MKTVELFAGIGGFKRSLDNNDCEVVFVSELDKSPSDMYKILHGETKIHGDILIIDEEKIPDHDLLVGGFPCQGFSTNGTRLGFEYKTGGLFFEMIRIAKEKQPKFILMENVPGLLNHDKGRTISIMIKELSDLGYAIDFEILTSTNFGLSQQRSRVFITASLIHEKEDWNVSPTKQVNKAKKMVLETFEGIKTFNFGYSFENGEELKTKEVFENIGEFTYLDLGEDLIKINDHDWRIKDGTLKGYTDFTPEPFYTTIDFSFMTSKTRRGRVKHGFTKTMDQSSDIAVYDGIGFRKINGLEASRLQGFKDEDYYKMKDAGIKENEIIRRFGRSVSVSIVDSLVARFQEIYE